MKNILCVTFPRSGHHLLMNCLLKYFGACRLMKGAPGFRQAGPLVYCEYYNHCHSIPCADERTTFQKSHDFDLRQHVGIGQDLVIQYRDPVPAIISYFRLKISKNVITDNVSDWKRFVKSAIPYYLGFIDKWVASKHKNACYVKYEKLIAMPSTVIREVLRFIDPYHLVDEALLSQIVKSQEIKARYLYRGFKYYNELQLRYQWGRLEYYAKKLIHFALPK